MGKTALCLSLVAGLTLVWVVMEAVACRWFVRLVAYRELIAAPDPNVEVIARVLVDLLRESDKTVALGRF